MTEIFSKLQTLDKQDHALLTALKEDARATVTVLADRINLSPNATAERLKRLLREGVIEAFTTRLSSKALGKTMLAFVEVKLDRVSPDVFQAFADAARDTEAIEECHMVAGGFDYLLKTRHADMAAYRSFLTDTLLSLPG
ncbi:MAG: Lrp/AsnC ligand binding domain-containing protein, partial [Pseudomonadota bacterium]